MIKNLAIGGGSNRAMLLLALVLGVVSAVLIGVFLSRVDNSGGGGVSTDTVPVVVASQNIPALTTITADMLSMKSVPKDFALPDAFQSVNGVAGQTTQVAITAGEQVLPAKVTTGAAALAQYGVNAPLSLVVPSGKRAFAIGLSEIAAAGGLIRAGDFVDVILSGGKTTGNSQTFLTPGAACYVVQAVEVLAVGSNLKKSATPGDASAIAAAQPDAAAKSATLAVTPEEVWWLAAAQQSVTQSGVGNQLWVSLRAFGDHGQSQALPNCGVVPGA